MEENPPKLMAIRQHAANDMMKQLADHVLYTPFDDST